MINATTTSIHTTSTYVPEVGDGLMVIVDVDIALVVIAVDKNNYNKLIHKSTIP